MLSQKSVPIIFSIADNQDLIYKELSGMGISHIGKYPNIDYYLLPHMIKAVEYSKTILDNKVLDVIDGGGAGSVAKILLAGI